MTVDQNYSRAPHALFGSTDRSHGSGNDHNLALIELVRLSLVRLVRLIQFLGRDGDCRPFTLGPLLVHRFAEAGTTEHQAEPETKYHNQSKSVLLSFHIAPFKSSANPIKESWACRTALEVPLFHARNALGSTIIG